MNLWWNMVFYSQGYLMLFDPCIFFSLIIAWILLTCTSLLTTFIAHALNYVRGGHQSHVSLHTMENGTRPTLFQEQLTCLTCQNQGLTCKASLTINPTLFIIQNHK